MHCRVRRLVSDSTPTRTFWDAAENILEKDDPRWLLDPDSVPMAATDWYVEQPLQRRIDMGRWITANTLNVAEQFEFMLIRGMVHSAGRLPNGSPVFRYLLHEMTDECNHIQMFQESSIALAHDSRVTNRSMSCRTLAVAEVQRRRSMLGTPPVSQVRRPTCRWLAGHAQSAIRAVTSSASSICGKWLYPCSISILADGTCALSSSSHGELRPGSSDTRLRAVSSVVLWMASRGTSTESRALSISRASQPAKSVIRVLPNPVGKRSARSTTALARAGLLDRKNIDSKKSRTKRR